MRDVAIIAAASMLISVQPAAAEEFSTTSVLYEYSSNLRDNYYGTNAADGKVTTITIEHFGVWEYGDNFFFVDLYSGKMADFGGSDTGSGSRLYAEWGPRLSLSRIMREDVALGSARDIFIAGQISRGGEGFTADMIGLGADFTVPGFDFVSLNLYSRKDNFNAQTYQVNVAWGSVFMAGPLNLLFEGYIDFAGTDNDGTDVNAQPRLLAGHAKGKSGSLMGGIEWYYHSNDLITQNLPQWVMKWTF